jgi:hypothetical protein
MLTHTLAHLSLIAVLVLLLIACNTPQGRFHCRRYKHKVDNFLNRHSAKIDRLEAIALAALSAITLLGIIALGFYLFLSDKLLTHFGM